MAISKRSPIKLAKAERTAQAAQLRRAGLTQDQIAERLGVSQPQISRDLDGVLLELNQIAREHVDAWRSAQVAELQTVRDEALAAFRQAKEPDKAAACLAIVVRAQEREAKLLGLDAPTQVDVSGGFAMPDEDTARAALEKAGWSGPE